MKLLKILTSQSTSLLSFVFLSGCVSVPGTDRKAFNIIPRAQEKQMGDDAYKEILSKEKVSRDQRLNAILQRVGKRISAVVPVTDFDWQFTLIESADKNAFCLPGGKVAFYTGIVPSLESEAGMAIVMGHEIAHAVARHGVERVSQAMVLQFGLAAVDVGVMQDSRYKGAVMAGLGLGAQFGVLLPFSRANESEADTLGIKYAAAAGYDPSEGPAFWQRFSKATGGGGKPPEFLSTHPSDNTRIQNLNSLLAEANVLYEQSPKYGLGEKF